MAATSTIDSELIFLMNKWGVAPEPAYQGTIPDGTGKWDGANSHNSVTAVFPVGTCIQAYNDGGVAGQSGPYEMMYLQASDAIAAAKDICVPASTTAHFAVTDSIATALNATNAQVAVAVGAVTIAYYGWFWVGGVCPEADVTNAMGGNYATDGSLDIGPMHAIDGGDAATIGFTASTGDSCGMSFSLDAT